MPTNFAGVGRSLSNAYTSYQAEQDKERKRKLLQDTLAKYQAKAGPAAPPLQALPPGATMLPAEMGMGQADTSPPLGAGMPMQGGMPGKIGYGIDELISPPAKEPEAVDESLNLLMDLASADVMPMENLFEYVATAGKLAKQQDGRMDVEKMKAELKRELQTEKLMADMEELKALVAGKKEVAQTYADAGVKKANIGAGAKVKAAGIASAGRGAGKPKDPTMMSEDEILAELEVQAAAADSLNNAGMDPAQVGRKDPAKQQFRIDETARQKDLSKVMERVRALQARQAVLGGGGGSAPAGGAASGGQVYDSPAAVKQARAAGQLKKGDRVPAMVNGVRKMINVDF